MTGCAAAVGIGVLLAFVASAPAVRAAEGEAGRAMGRALSLLETGDFDAAEAVLLGVLESAPEHGPAHFQLGRIALERGDAAGARRHLTLAVSTPLPRPYLAWHLLARAEMLAGRPAAAGRAWDEAARRAAEVLATQPDHVPALRVAVAAAEAGGDRWGALEGYAALLDRLPEAAPLLAAAARLAQALGAVAAADRLAARAVAAAPLDPALHHLRGAVQLAAGDAVAAAASCRRALELGADDPQVEITLARALFETLEVAPAIAAYGRALALDPRLIELVPRVALSSLAAADPAALGVGLGEVQAADPQNAAALYGLGLAALRQGDLARARTHFELLVALRPDDSEARYNLGQAYIRQGEAELGRAAMERFARLEAAAAADWERHAAAFRSRLQATELAAVDPVAALGIYQRLAAAELATGEDFLAAGHILLDLDDGVNAAAWFERILQGSPYDRFALEGLVLANEAAGREDEAASYRHRLSLVSRLAAPPPGR